jgi:hypothetical protein
MVNAGNADSGVAIRTSEPFLGLRSQILEHLHFAGKAADVSA